MIEQTQRFASGGWGPKEAFVPPHQGGLGDALTSTKDHFETPCGCYAHVKLARYLLRFTADARYGDGLERVLYNTVLGAKDPDDDGNYFYYSNYQAGARKGYYQRKWSCCSGTLAQGVSDYPINIYFHAPGAVYVNLFTPSEVKWRAGSVPVTVTQTGEYPDGETQEFHIDAASPAEFTLHVRVPGWLHADPEFRVNGKTFNTPSFRGTFAAVKCRWKKDDRLEVRFPLRFREEPVDDRHPDTAALMRGALMYVAVNNGSVAPPDDPERARAQSQLVPFHAVKDETYNTYFVKGT